LVGDWDFGGDLAHASSGWVLLVSASVPNENVKDKKKKEGQGKFTVGFLSPAAELRRSTCTLMEPWERAVHTLLSWCALVPKMLSCFWLPYSLYSGIQDIERFKIYIRI